MSNAHHDHAVQLLTDHQRFVRLVVQREVSGPFSDMPASPRSPILKGLSPSGYLANRPGKKEYSNYLTDLYSTEVNYLLGPKRSIGDVTEHIHHIQNHYTTSTPATTPSTTTVAQVSSNETGNGVDQPVPAPRRVSSIPNGNTIQNGTSGNKSEDEDPQVRITISKYYYHN